MPPSPPIAQPNGARSCSADDNAITSVAFYLAPNRKTLRQTRRRAGRYLPRNLGSDDRAKRMIDVVAAETDDRADVLSRYTELGKDRLLLLRLVNLQFPARAQRIAARNSREGACQLSSLAPAHEAASQGFQRHGVGHPRVGNTGLALPAWWRRALSRRPMA